ncbi:MAG: cytochrome c oxidase subunit II [Acidobacteria bacterium]|nr:cytochrome c oxidase subunit II [Acidobacteriota bacterium]
MAMRRIFPLKLPVEALLVGGLFLLTGFLGVGYGARIWLPPLASRHGAGIDAMLTYLLVAVGALFLVGHVALGVLIWRAARQPRITHRLATRKTEWVLSAALGLLMALVAEGGVLAIGIPVWSEYFGAVPPRHALLVEVTAQQFVWNVRYPGDDGVFGRTDARLIDDASNPIGTDRDDPAAADDVVLQNEIAVPVGQPVTVRLRSKDVIHSFFLPHLRVKQDAVPGMTPEIVFVPTRKGTFEIACAELCGLAHYRMQGFLHVLSEDEFRLWLQEHSSGS